MLLYNGQWYYGNQSNVPTLVSESKEVNIIQSYSSLDTGSFTVSSEYYTLNFTSVPNYYTYDFIYLDFATTWIVSQISFSGDYGGIGIVGLNAPLFDIQNNTIIEKHNHFVFMKTNLSSSSGIEALVFIDDRAVANATSCYPYTWDFTGLDKPFQLESYYGNDVTLNRTTNTIRLFCSKIEY